MLTGYGTPPSVVVSFTGCVPFHLCRTLSVCKRRIAPVSLSAPPGFFLLVIPLCLLRVPLSLVVVFCCFVLVLRWCVLFVMRRVVSSAGSFPSLTKSFALPVFMRRTVILQGTTFLRMSQIAWIRPSLPSCAAISTPLSTAHCTALAPTLLTHSGRVRWLSPTCSIACASQTSGGIYTPMLLLSPGTDGTAVFRLGSTWLACLFRGFRRWPELPSAFARFRTTVPSPCRSPSRMSSLLAQDSGNSTPPSSRTRITSISSPVFGVGGAWHRHAFHLCPNGGRRGNKKLRASVSNFVVNGRRRWRPTDTFHNFFICLAVSGRAAPLHLCCTSFTQRCWPVPSGPILPSKGSSSRAPLLHFLSYHGMPMTLHFIVGSVHPVDVFFLFSIREWLRIETQPGEIQRSLAWGLERSGWPPGGARVVFGQTQVLGRLLGAGKPWGGELASTYFSRGKRLTVLASAPPLFERSVAYHRRLGLGTYLVRGLPYPHAIVDHVWAE